MRTVQTTTMMHIPVFNCMIVHLAFTHAVGKAHGVLLTNGKPGSTEGLHISHGRSLSSLISTGK